MADTQMRADIICTLNQLMDKKQLSEITMKDIANKCGVSRQTIYYHFNNLEELIESAFEEQLEQFLKKINQCGTAKEIMTEMILFAKYKSELVSRFAADKQNTKIGRQIHRIIKQVLMKISDEQALSELTKSEYEKTISFYSYAFAGILTDIGKENEDTDKTAEQLLRILCRGFKIRDGALTES